MQIPLFDAASALGCVFFEKEEIIVGYRHVGDSLMNFNIGNATLSLETWKLLVTAFHFYLVT